MTDFETGKKPVSFGAFFEENVDRGRRLAWRLLGGDEAAAEDVLQDAFVKAFRSWGRFRGESRRETWFYRIVVNEAQSYRRWRGVRDKWNTLWDEQVPEPSSVKPGDPVMRERIVKSLAELSRAQRDVFVLVHLEGFTLREVASLLGKSEGTVKTHLHRGLAKLRKELSDLHEEAA
jgi:RNA polymerase sigma-70 factor (ECF subfamily)